MAKVDILMHNLVPKHTILTEEEAKEVLEKYNISAFQLPKMYVTDKVAIRIGAKAGDIVKIERKSPTAAHSYAYRLVIESR